MIVRKVMNKMKSVGTSSQKISTTMLVIQTSARSTTICTIEILLSEEITLFNAKMIPCSFECGTQTQIVKVVSFSVLISTGRKMAALLASTSRMRSHSDPNATHTTRMSQRPSTIIETSTRHKNS